MATRKKLTAIGIKSLKPPKTGRVEILDTVVPQMALRVTANGTKSFSVRTRIAGAGKQVRVTRGEFPSTSLEDARQAARDALNMAKRGINATDVKQQDIAEKRVQAANTFSAVADLFVRRYALKNQKTWGETQRKLEMYILPVWGSRPISEITRRDVITLLDDIEDRRTASTANRVRKLLRQIFNWAVERDIIDTTPVVGRNAIVREVPRDRYLSEDEIRAVWNVCDDLSYPFGPLIRLLIVTGQRRGEVA
ncbi:MAG: integrase arm-type DNA-binding domain-containing protein, partial [Alphaproteobacteria bacterium]|nr:integrase arm-type DNA-binding domain-containing protein [Alphaproteobacteria bacterium]